MFHFVCLAILPCLGNARSRSAALVATPARNTRPSEFTYSGRTSGRARPSCLPAATIDHERDAMSMPNKVGVIDLMLQIPTADGKKRYDFLRPFLLDKESRDSFDFPAQYMFKDIPDTSSASDYVALTLREMDKYGIERAMIGLSRGHSSVEAERGLSEHPDRFFPSFEVNPNLGMEGVRDLVRAHEKYGIKAATAFPSGLCPQVPINDKKFYPLYAKCVELDIPICICAGVPGPRVPMMAQDVALLDEVCWFFPDLKIVTRHGCEP